MKQEAPDAKTCIEQELSSELHIKRESMVVIEFHGDGGAMVVIYT